MLELGNRRGIELETTVDCKMTCTGSFKENEKVQLLKV
jgi:hypothetical protein